MKLRKVLFLTALIISFYPSRAQVGIVGSWQLVTKSTCLEQESGVETDDAKRLRKNMHSQASASGQTVSFKSNMSGEESTRILNSGKVANQKKFYYKFNGEMLLILDKKTQTISDSYMVDKFSADSLVISNASRPCETIIFVKINELPPN